MRIVVDLNVLLDVVQKRKVFYSSSAAVLQAVVEKKVQGYIPAHLVTTLYYLTAKYSSKGNADYLVRWLLNYFEIGVESEHEFLMAVNLGFADFEDAVVSSVAMSMQCDAIVTRNIKDFQNSPVHVLTPEEFVSSIYGSSLT